MSGEGAMHEFVRTVWMMRQSGPISLGQRWKHLQITRLLYQAISSEMEHDERYDPEIDHRVTWARELLGSCRGKTVSHPSASAVSEAMISYLLGVGDFAEDAAINNHPANFETE